MRHHSSIKPIIIPTMISLRKAIAAQCLILLQVSAIRPHTENQSERMTWSLLRSATINCSLLSEGFLPFNQPVYSDTLCFEYLDVLVVAYVWQEITPKMNHSLYFLSPYTRNVVWTVCCIVILTTYLQIFIIIKIQNFRNKFYNSFNIHIVI